MKKLITIIIIVAFGVNSGGQGYALRPMASAIDQEHEIIDAHSNNYLLNSHTKSSSAREEGSAWRVPAIIINDNTALPDIEKYMDGISGQHKHDIRRIEDERHQIRHEIKGRKRLLISKMGKDFNEVFWIEGTMLVEKKLKQGLNMVSQHETLELAISRLRGLAAKTYIYHERLIQEYVEPLMRHKEEAEQHGLLLRVSEEDAMLFIDKYFELLNALFKRGVFDVDFNLFNCGRNLAGDIVIFDFGAMTGSYPDDFELSRLRMAMERELAYISNLLPAAVCEHYEKRMYDLCGDNTAYNNIHRNFYSNITYKMWEKMQSKRLTRLGLPHPYPLKALMGLKSSSSGYVKNIDELKRGQVVRVRRINKLTNKTIWVRIIQVIGIDIKSRSVLLETIPIFKGERAYTYFEPNEPTCIRDRIKILEEDFSFSWDAYYDLQKKIKECNKAHKSRPVIIKNHSVTKEIALSA